MATSKLAGLAFLPVFVAAGTGLEESAVVVRTNAAEPPSPFSAGVVDKCMKATWPNVVDDCGGPVGYHGGCEARVANLLSEYGGSCDRYCSSFGFACTGGRKATDAPGCEEDETDSATSYFDCSAKSTQEEAICSCYDPHDTFLWHTAKRACGAGKALVLPTAASTCSTFCTARGLACAGAARAVGEDCSAGEAAACSDEIGNSGSLCRCDGEYDRSGTFLWPDKLAVCSMSTVLVSGGVLKEQGGTCDGYCAGLRKRVPDYDLYYSCYAAWPAGGFGCGAANNNNRRLRGLSATDACQEDFHGADAVCSCSFADL